jgi:hypothetical protein
MKWKESIKMGASIFVAMLIIAIPINIFCALIDYNFDQLGLYNHPLIYLAQLVAIVLVCSIVVIGIKYNISK